MPLGSVGRQRKACVTLWLPLGTAMKPTTSPRLLMPRVCMTPYGPTSCVSDPVDVLGDEGVNRYGPSVTCPKSLMAVAMAPDVGDRSTNCPVTPFGVVGVQSIGCHCLLASVAPSAIWPYPLMSFALLNWPPTGLRSSTT